MELPIGIAFRGGDPAPTFLPDSDSDRANLALVIGVGWPLTVEVEAKAKELGLARLQRELLSVVANPRKANRMIAL